MCNLTAPIQVKHTLLYHTKLRIKVVHDSKIKCLKPPIVPQTIDVDIDRILISGYKYNLLQTNYQND